MSSTTGTDDPASAQGSGGPLLWRTPDEPTRGPRRGLTLDEIARAAVEVADRDGLAGLSMQRVAAEVGLTKMALYRYVANKDELEAIMIDAAVEEPPGPEALVGTWREQAEEFARLVSDVWTRHPWLPWVTVGERVMGPREVGWVEAAVRVFEPLGLAPDERMDAVSMLFGHLRTTLAHRLGRHPAVDRRPRGREHDARPRRRPRRPLSRPHRGDDRPRPSGRVRAGTSACGACSTGSRRPPGVARSSR